VLIGSVSLLQPWNSWTLNGNIPKSFIYIYTYYVRHQESNIARLGVPLPIHPSVEAERFWYAFLARTTSVKCMHIEQLIITCLISLLSLRGRGLIFHSSITKFVHDIPYLRIESLRKNQKGMPAKRNVPQRISYSWTWFRESFFLPAFTSRLSKLVIFASVLCKYQFHSTVNKDC
jgi:hypothetical protein